MEPNKKRRYPNSFDDDSDTNSIDDDLQTSGGFDPATHFPRYILMESLEEERKITSLSPFVVQKAMLGIIGQPKSIKALHGSGQLLIEVGKRSHAEGLLRTQKFHDLKVKVFPHSALNSSKGVIRCSQLKGLEEKDILEDMKSEGVTHVKRFMVKRNGEMKPTNTFVFTFNTPQLPEYTNIGYLRVKVEVYIPNPLRCYHCQQYGHHELRCNKEHPVCATCAEPVNHPSCKKQPKWCS